MSEIGPTVNLTKDSGSLLSLARLTTSQLQMSPRVAGYIANVPHQAQSVYRLLLDDGTILPAGYLHIRQRLGSLMILEARIHGRLADHSWAVDGIGREVSLFAEALTLNETVLASDLLLVAPIQNISSSWETLTLYGVCTIPERAAQSVEVQNILFLQLNSSGKRALRCPVAWGVQAGDILKHPDMTDFKVEHLSITLSPGYRVLDATEVM